MREASGGASDPAPVVFLRCVHFAPLLLDCLGKTTSKKWAINSPDVVSKGPDENYFHLEG
jgi:hypothetical protein